jgi:hypothetical protein
MSESKAWLWPGRIHRGRLTLLVGDSGVGKSFLALDMAARVSTGAAWPDGSGCAPAGHVLVLSNLDENESVNVSRLKQQGADLSNVSCIVSVDDETNGTRPFYLDRDVSRLSDLIRELACPLVIIDLLITNEQTRPVPRPLAQVAKDTGAAILGIAWLTKNTRRPAAERVLGGRGYVSVAGAIHAVAPDPRRKERYIFGPVKMTVGSPAPCLAYRIVDPLDNDEPRLEWEPGTLDMDMDALLRGTTRHTR